MGDAFSSCLGPPIPDFSGTWRLDVDKSDTPEKLMEAQGLSWIAQKASSLAQGVSNVTHDIKHDKSAKKMTIMVTSTIKSVTINLSVDGSEADIQTEEADIIKGKTLWKNGMVITEGTGEKGSLKLCRQLLSPTEMKLDTFFKKGDKEATMICYFKKDVKVP
eukprot:Platyproteum_vivax@DN4495_c0_g1_i1.p1